MNISERRMSNEEMLFFSKNFLENDGYRDYFFEKKDSKIFIYNENKITYIIEGTIEEISILYNLIQNKIINSEIGIETLINILYFINGTYLYFVEKTKVNFLIINNCLSKYTTIENIFDKIYIAEDNKLRNITEQEFKIHCNNIFFKDTDILEYLNDEIIIFLDKDFDIISYSYSNTVESHGSFQSPYYFYKSFNDLKVANIPSNSMLYNSSVVPNSNFFYQILKNKIVIYEHKDNKVEYFSEIKIKESYWQLRLNFIKNKFKLTFATRGNAETNSEFYLITEKNKKPLLVFKYKKNNSHEIITINTTKGKKIVFDSKKEENNIYKTNIKNVEFDIKEGIVINDKKDIMYYDGKEIKLINNYNLDSWYLRIKDLFFLKNGISFDNSVYVTYNGEILPIKSFINNETLILSIVKKKVENGKNINMTSIRSDFSKEILKLKAERIDKNIEGYKSKLNKEILKEFIK